MKDLENEDLYLKGEDFEDLKLNLAALPERPLPKVTLQLECSDTGIAQHILVLYTTLTLYAECQDGDRMPIEMAEGIPDTLEVLRDAVLDMIEVEDGGKRGYIGSTELEGDRWEKLRRFLEFPENWKPSSASDEEEPDLPN